MDIIEMLILLCIKHVPRKTFAVLINCLIISMFLSYLFSI